MINELTFAQVTGAHLLLDEADAMIEQTPFKFWTVGKELAITGLIATTVAAQCIFLSATTNLF